ncbi:MAG: hypothetical protein GXZ08_05155, partial [Tissierellia bacterium]|nr:hypothetical protein [Tissierellia bacterium]
MNIYTNNKNLNVFLALVILFTTVMVFPTSVKAADKEVGDVAGLQDAINSAVEGDVITLADGFTFANATLTVANVNVTIDGGNKVWNAGSIKVEGAGTGSLTIKNLKMDGSNNITTRLLTNKASNGTLILEEMEFYNANAMGALDISTSGNAKTELNRVHIHDNIAAAAGPAIYLGANSNADINYSTIENNSGLQAAYECGAIGGKGFSANLEINNTVFRNNINKAVNTKVYGGGGGAISFNSFNKGTITINESLFEGNSTNGPDGDKRATYDGGAINIFNMKKDAKLDIKNSSFINNIAYDDGGAILIQTEGSGNGDVVDKIYFTNNTFYGNKAYGVDNAAYSGGAIQIYANVGFTGTLHTKAKFVGNTFTYNEVGGNSETDGTAGGSAIGLSMASFRSTMKIYLDNNLFVGNAIIDENGDRDYIENVISLSNYIENTNAKDINIGLNPDVNLINDALGKYEVEPVVNHTEKVAGVKNEPILTIPIKPEGVAENKSAEQTGADQRGYARDKDFGAVEIAWIKYDANGGIFDIDELTEYDGTVYYEPNSDGDFTDKITTYYSVGNIDGNTSVVDGNETLKANLDGKVFKGWSTDPGATEPDENYPVGQELTYVDDNLTLYAVWGEDTPSPEPSDKLTVNYNGNGHTSGNVPTDKIEYDSGDTVEVLNGKGLEKEGYIFKGWSTDRYSEKVQYLAGDTFIIKENTTLYAVWEKDDY